MFTITSSKCPDCKSDDIIVVPTEGKIVCKSCASVLQYNLIDESYEGRNFNNENTQNRDQNRVGGPLHQFEMNDLGTSIQGDIGTSNNKFNKNKTNSAYNQRTNSAIDDIAGKLEANNNIKLKVKNYYKLFEEKQKMKGRNLQEILTAMFYFAFCADHNLRGVKEVATKTEIDVKKLKKAINFVDKSLSLNQVNDTLEHIRQLIRSYCVKTQGINTDFKNLAESLVNNMSYHLQSRRPTTVMSCCIIYAYLLMGQKVPDIDSITGGEINRKTVEDAYQHVFAYKESIVGEKWKDKVAKIASNL